MREQRGAAEKKQAALRQIGKFTSRVLLSAQTACHILQRAHGGGVHSKWWMDKRSLLGI